MRYAPGRIEMENGANGIKCDWRSWEIKMLMETLCTMKKGHKANEFFSQSWNFTDCLQTYPNLCFLFC